MKVTKKKFEEKLKSVYGENIKVETMKTTLNPLAEEETDKESTLTQYSVDEKLVGMFFKGYALVVDLTKVNDFDFEYFNWKTEK